jgi:regulator of replication initiation timing
MSECGHDEMGVVGENCMFCGTDKPVSEPKPTEVCPFDELVIGKILTDIGQLYGDITPRDLNEPFKTMLRTYDKLMAERDALKSKLASIESGDDPFGWAVRAQKAEAELKLTKSEATLAIEELEAEHYASKEELSVAIAERDTFRAENTKLKRQLNYESLKKSVEGGK